MVTRAKIWKRSMVRKNYRICKSKITYMVYARKFQQPLRKKPKKMCHAEWDLFKRYSPGVIRLPLSKIVMHKVSKEKTTEALTKVRSDIYEKLSTK